MNIRPWVFNSGLIVIALTTSAMLWSSSWFSTSIPKKSINMNDAYMTHVALTQYNDDGELDFEMFTPISTHYPDGNDTLLKKPHFIIFSSNANDAPWSITSLSGRMLNGIEEVHLWDQVEMVQKNTTEPNGTQVLTSEVFYYPEDRVANTSKPVKMTQTGLSVTAVGVDVNFDTGAAKLLSSVKGRYDPTISSK